MIIDKSSDLKSIYIYVAQRINVFFLFDANEIYNTLSTDSGRNLLIHVYRGNLAVGEELLNSIVPSLKKKYYLVLLKISNQITQIK